MKKQSVSMPKRVTAAMLAAVMVQSSVIYTPTVALAADDAPIESEAGVELEASSYDLTFTADGTDRHSPSSQPSSLKAGDSLKITVSYKNERVSGIYGKVHGNRICIQTSEEHSKGVEVGDTVEYSYDNNDTLTYTYTASKNCNVGFAFVNAEESCGEHSGYRTATLDVIVDETISDEAQAVIDKIGKIGTVAYTSDCKASIENAEAAYAALTADQKKEVQDEGSYAKLTAARSAYNALQQAVDDTIKAINAVDTDSETEGIQVRYTTACGNAVADARAKYNNLNGLQRSAVTNYSAFVTAEEAYNKLAAQVKEVKTAIDGLDSEESPLVYTQAKKDAIESTRDAYNKLNDDQKAALVEDGTYAKLVKAEADFQTLREGVEAVEKKIDAIGEVKVDEASKASIDEARKAYDALTAEQKAAVSNYDTLTLDEATYYVGAIDRDAETEGCQVTYTPECKQAIETARKAYDALTDEQKASASDLAKTLEGAEKDYNDLQTAVNTVIDDIKAIDQDAEKEDTQVRYTDTCKQAIETARKAYDALNDLQKKAVTNIDDLTGAETAYTNLDNAVKDVQKQIAAVDQDAETEGCQVTYTPECKQAIETAEKAYDNLDDDQKAAISDEYTVLTGARKAYDALQQAVDDTIADIDKIDQDAKTAGCQVTYTDACKQALDKAREDYDALNDLQKAAVTNYSTLEGAEDDYKVLDDQVQAVVKLIDAIGDVHYTSTCRDAIDAARLAYNKLNSDQQAALATKYETVTKDEDVYESMKQATNAAIEALTNLPAASDVSYPASLETIANARKAYDDLEQCQKDHVSKELVDKLAADEDALAVSCVDSLIADLPAAGEVTCKNAVQAEDVEGSGADIKAARDAYNKLSEELQKKVADVATLEARETEYAVRVAEFLADQIPARDAEGFSEALAAARDAYNKLNDDQKATFKADEDGKFYNELFDAEKNNFVDLVNAIGEVERSEKCAAAISAAEAAYKNLDEAGKADAKVVEEKAHLDNAKELFEEITGKEMISEDDVTVEDGTYTGDPVTPVVYVKVGNKVLGPDDYTVEYSNNVQVGKGTVTVTGTGDQADDGYWGSVTKEFNIAAADISDAIVAASDQVYTGSELKPEVTVMLGDVTLTEDDYTVEYSGNIEVGTATVTVKGTGNYTGTATGTFEIKGRDLSEGAIAKIDDQTYTGKAVKPAVTVTYGDETLTEGTDYTVAYVSNTNVGTATVEVYGKGTYAGKLTQDFTIKAADLSDDADVTIENQTYTGKALEPTVTVKVGDKTLKQGKDFEVEYSDNTEPGTAKVKITGEGNYTGTIEAEFDIVDNGVKMQRLYNPYTGEHLYTSSEVEVENLKAAGWNHEGDAWTAPSTGTEVHRLYNPYVEGGDHFYTTSTAEVEMLKAAGWSYEGVAWYSADSETGTPVYRAYNPYASTGTHHYTSNAGEIESLVAAGWSNEGTAWYGLK